MTAPRTRRPDFGRTKNERTGRRIARSRLVPPNQKPVRVAALRNQHLVDVLGAHAVPGPVVEIEMAHDPRRIRAPNDFTQGQSAFLRQSRIRREKQHLPSAAAEFLRGRFEFAESSEMAEVHIARHVETGLDDLRLKDILRPAVITFFRRNIEPDDLAPVAAIAGHHPVEIEVGRVLRHHEEGGLRR